MHDTNEGRVTPAPRFDGTSTQSENHDEIMADDNMLDMKLAESELPFPWHILPDPSVALAPEEFHKTFVPSAVDNLPAPTAALPKELPIELKDVLESYPDTRKTDKDLLDEFFQRDPKLSAQLANSKSNRRKRQSDGNLVRDYRFNVALYQFLLKHQWEVCLDN